MSLEFVEPEGWEPPSGYSNGVRAPAGARLVFVAGQIAWDADQVLVGKGDFAAQFVNLGCAGLVLVAFQQGRFDPQLESISFA